MPKSDIDADIAQLFKSDGHYCAECVGNRNEHADGCTVPAQIEQIHTDAATKEATEREMEENKTNGEDIE